MLVFIDEVLNSGLLTQFLVLTSSAGYLLTTYLLCNKLSNPLEPITLSEDRSTVRGIPLEEHLKQMLVGIMLSDGTLVKKHAGGNTYFQMAQSIIHLPYLTHVHSLFVAAS